MTATDAELIAQVEAVCGAATREERQAAILALWRGECARLGVDPDEAARQAGADWHQALGTLGEVAQIRRMLPGEYGGQP